MASVKAISKNTKMPSLEDTGRSRRSRKRIRGGNGVGPSEAEGEIDGKSEHKICTKVENNISSGLETSSRPSSPRKTALRQNESGKVTSSPGDQADANAWRPKGETLIGKLSAKSHHDKPGSVRPDDFKCSKTPVKSRMASSKAISQKNAQVKTGKSTNK